MRVFKSIIDALYPRKCISCGKIIDSREHLCDYCFEMLRFIDFSKVCLVCGLAKKHCQCKNRVFHFGGAVAPFENKEIAKAAMYRYKFKKISSAAIFFGQEMAKTVKTVYHDLDFDGVTFVPMHRRKQMMRGFNQAEQLSRVIADAMNLKVYDKLLSAKYVSVKQHDLPLKERFQNVKDVYNYNYKVTGKTILLVDDIKTTGATLDACARQLLLAGADNVYCITGLISESKKGKK